MYQLYCQCMQKQNAIKNAWYNSLKKLDRDDGPAIVYENGDTEYYVNGFLMRRVIFSKSRKNKNKIKN